MIFFIFLLRKKKKKDVLLCCRRILIDDESVRLLCVSFSSLVSHSFLNPYEIRFSFLLHTDSTFMVLLFINSFMLLNTVAWTT